MILYKHKETGYQISREDLKKLLKRDISTIVFGTYNEDISVTDKQEYLIKEIPFDDDWEVLDTGIDDFTIEELITCISIIRDYTQQKKISCSLLGKLCKLYTRKIKEQQGSL